MYHSHMPYVAWDWLQALYNLDEGKRMDGWMLCFMLLCYVMLCCYTGSKIFWRNISCNTLHFIKNILLFAWIALEYFFQIEEVIVNHSMD